MPQPPRTAPVRQFPSPIPADLLLVEKVSAKVATNDPLEPGARYPGNTKDQREKWGEAVFLGQRAIDGNDADVLRIWATDPVLQNLYNFIVGFSGEADAAPIFVRQYLVRRDDYSATKPAKLSVYSGVYRVRVTDAGLDYTANFAVTATGGVGSGFTGLAIVNPDGGVECVVVVTEGTGYTSAPTIDFSTGNGAGAAAVGVIQSASCKLTEEKTAPAPDAWNSLYMLATRTYETLPGPWIPDNRDHLLLGPVQRNKRTVENTGQAAVPTATGNTTYEGRDGSSVVLWEIVESWSDGTGSGAANPVYPHVEAPIFYDDERGSVHGHSQIERIIWKVTGAAVTAGGTGGTNGTQTVTGTTGTGTPFQASVTVAGGIITAILSITVAGSYTVRPTAPAAEPVTGASLVGATLSLTLDASQVATFTATATLATLVRYEKFNEFLIEKVTEFWTLPGPLVTLEPEYEQDSGVKITHTKRMKLRSAITEDYAITGGDPDGILTITTRAPTQFGDDVAFEAITVYPVAVAKSSGTAIEWEEERPYQYPGRINFTDDSAGNFSITTYGIQISTSVHDPNPNALLVAHTIKTWFINSVTKPTLTFQEFFPKTLTFSDGDVTRTFNNVLFNTVLLTFGAFTGTIPATTPNYTAFKALIGTSVVIDGSIKETRRYRWKLQSVSVIMR